MGLQQKTMKISAQSIDKYLVGGYDLTIITYEPSAGSYSKVQYCKALIPLSEWDYLLYEVMTINVF